MWYGESTIITIRVRRLRTILYVVAWPMTFPPVARKASRPAEKSSGWLWTGYDTTAILCTSLVCLTCEALCWVATASQPMFPYPKFCSIKCNYVIRLALYSSIDFLRSCIIISKWLVLYILQTYIFLTFWLSDSFVFRYLKYPFSPESVFCIYENQRPFLSPASVRYYAI